MSEKRPNRLPKYLAEGFATFCLVFFGTGAIVVNETYHSLTHLGVSLVFGLVVLVMIYAVGSTSGAHMNPAVTAGFLALRRITLRESAIYVAVQILGAIAASLVLRFLFPASETLGETLPSNGGLQSFAMEAILTAILMFVILGVAHENRAEGLMAGVAIGATIAIEALVGGPVSGASMNPARSIGPAVVQGHFSSLWIYIVATLIGSVIAAKIFPLFVCDPAPNADKVGCC